MAGNQLYEPLAADVRIALRSAIAERKPPRHAFDNPLQAADWLSAMSQRLERRLPDIATRLDFLRSLHYEASRAGLDPQSAARSATRTLMALGFKVDYFTARNAETLAPPVHRYEPLRLITAAWLGKTRLIDNVPV